MAVLFTQPYFQAFDNDGNPLSGGKLFTFSAGTNTPKRTFTTEDGSVEHTNPVVLDSAGRATIFIEGSYRYRLEDADGNVIRTVDNVTSFINVSGDEDPFFESFSGDGTQTVFTLSEDLGVDEKTVMIFVDGGSAGFEIQAPGDYTLDKTSLTFNTAPASGTQNIYVFAPSKIVGAATSSADAAASSATAAAASAADAEDSANKLVGTSATSVAVGVGTKIFTTQEDKFFTTTNFVMITSDADPSNFMFGQVTSYVGTSIEVNVLYTGGSGTFADWTIKISGARGAVGSVNGDILVSNNDTTAGKLNDKIDGITIQNPAGNEKAVVYPPIGMPFPLWDNLTGVTAPDNSGTAKFLKLTAGESGTGEYNEGLLTSESVSGGSPQVTATAQIVGGDLDGQTVHLINTEESFLRARTTSGVKQNDQMQRITGESNSRQGVQDALGSTGAITDSPGQFVNMALGNGGSSIKHSFDSTNSPNARTSSSTNGETRSKNVSATFYMRVQ